MGPYTQKASGEVSDMVTEALSTPSGAEAVVTEQFDPIASQRQQGRRLTFMGAAPGYGWAVRNDDFYGNIPNNPNQYQSSRVGKYGGDPLFAPSNPRMAYDIIASKLQGVAEQQQRLDAQKQEALSRFNPMGGFDNKFKRGPYRQNLDKLAVQMYERKMADIEAAGVSMAELAQKPWLQEKYGLTGLTRDLNTIGTTGQQALDDMIAYQTGVKTGQQVDDPILTRLANEGLAAEGAFSGGDIHKISGLIKNWQTASSVSKMIEDSGVLKNIEAQIVASDPRAYRDPKTGQLITVLDHTSTYDALAKVWAKEHAPLYEGTGVTEKDLVDSINARLQKQVKRDLHIQNPPQPTAASMKERPAEIGVEIGTEKIGTGPVKEYARIPLPTLSKPIELTGGSGKSYQMMPTRIIDDGKGGRYIKGLVLKKDSDISMERVERNSYYTKDGQEITKEEYAKDPASFKIVPSDQVRYYKTEKDGTKHEISAREAATDMEEGVVRYDENFRAIETAYGRRYAKEVLDEKFGERKPEKKSDPLGIL